MDRRLTDLLPGSRFVSLALYRRYRPQRFADLVGQEVVARTLLNEVRSGELATATSSPASAAPARPRRLASSPARSTATRRRRRARQRVPAVRRDPQRGGGGRARDRCGEQPQHRRHARAPRAVGYLPAALRRKVYIIDEAHMLTTDAWNAFLKTLEEPPPHVLFVLATTEPHKVPETIRSRVQRFDFRRVPVPAIEQLLADVAAQRGRARRRRRAAAARDVGAGQPPRCARPARAGARRRRAPGHHRRSRGVRSGSPTRRPLHALVTSLAGADAAGTLRAAAAAFDAGADPRQLFRDVARLARAAELVALGYPEGASVGPDEVALVADLAAIAPAGLWLRLLELVAEAEMNLRQSVDARLLVEVCLLRALRPPAADGESGRCRRARRCGWRRSSAARPAPPVRGPGSRSRERPCVPT